MRSTTRATSFPFPLLLIATCALLAGGCGGGEAKKALESTINLRQLTMAVMTYETSNGSWPENLEQLKAADATVTSLMTNPLTGDNPGYEYVKPEGELTAGRTNTVVFYQLRGGERDESVAVAYLDGSVRTLDGAE